MHFSGAPIGATTNPFKHLISSERTTWVRYWPPWAKTQLIVEAVIWDPILVPERIAVLHYRGQWRRMQRKQGSSEGYFALGAHGSTQRCRSRIPTEHVLITNAAYEQKVGRSLGAES